MGVCGNKEERGERKSRETRATCSVKEPRNHSGASPSHTFPLCSSYILPLLSLGCWVAWGPPHAPLWSVRRQPPHLSPAGIKFVLGFEPWMWHLWKWGTGEIHTWGCSSYTGYCSLQPHGALSCPSCRTYTIPACHAFVPDWGHASCLYLLWKFHEQKQILASREAGF